MKINQYLIILIVALCAFTACDYEIIPDIMEGMGDMPKACFVTDKTICHAVNCTITFDATCSEPNADVVRYRWDFDGDGIFSPGGDDIVTYTYETAGTYVAKLEIQLANGKTADTTQIIYVKKNIAIPDGKIYQGCEIMFDNSSISDATYVWDFGDGSTAENENPVHYYTEPGTYTISLTTSLYAETIEDRQTITISPSIKFEQEYGPSLGHSYSDVIIAPDGGYVLAGQISGINSDAYISKTDNFGNLQWEKIFSGSSMNSSDLAHDGANAVAITPDGGYVLAGYTSGERTGSRNVYMLKTDANGVMKWEKTFGGSADDEAHTIAIAPDGGYVLAGYTSGERTGSRDAYLIKTDANGNLQWEKTFGGDDDDEFKAIVIEADGSYVLAGCTASSPGQGDDHSDVYLIKTNINGDLKWEKTFGADDMNCANAIVVAPDGGYVLAGYQFGISSGAYLIKTDVNGNLQWEKTFVGMVPTANDIAIAPDGGYVLAGHTNNLRVGVTEPYLIKTDSHGILQWEKAFDANGSFNAIKTTEDCGYIIAGNFGNNFYQIKTDSEGRSN